MFKKKMFCKISQSHRKTPEIESNFDKNAGVYPFSMYAKFSEKLSFLTS